MSVDLAVHADLGLEIVMEFPSNQQGLRLRARKGPWTDDEYQAFMLYTSLDQWHELRRVIPKAKDYYLAVEGASPNLRDHAEADAYAEEFYTRELAQLTPPPAPEPNDEVGDMLRGLPIIGTLNVDTNRFTPAPGCDATGAPQMIPVSELDAQGDTDIPDMPPEPPGTDDIVDPDAPSDRELAEAEAHADELTY